MKEDSAAEEARHTAAVQNLTSVALKEKASAMMAKWRVQQALKVKKKHRDALTKLQTHEMKTQMAINTLTEHDAQIKKDITEAEAEVAEASKLVQEKSKAYKEQMKVSVPGSAFCRSNTHFVITFLSTGVPGGAKCIVGGKGNTDPSTV